MVRYKNIAGNSGIDAFEIATQSITIRFSTNAAYIYTYNSAGKANVEKMKKLAMAGKGLSTFISQHVKDKYEAMLK